MNKEFPKLPYSNPDPLQDYYRDRDGNEYNVARLVDDTKHLKPFDCPIAALSLSDHIWHGENMFGLAWHVKRCVKADLTKPIILDWNGDIADGRHRILKALMLGKRTIKAVRITWRVTPCRTAKTDG